MLKAILKKILPYKKEVKPPPVAGEKYSLPLEKPVNPFCVPEKFVVLVLEVKDDWIKYVHYYKERPEHPYTLTLAEYSSIEDFENLYSVKEVE